MKKLFIMLAGLIALIPASRAQNNVNGPVAQGEAFYYYHNEKVRLKPLNDVLFVSFADKDKFEKAKQLPSTYKSELLKLNERTDFHQQINAIRFTVNKANFVSDEKIREFADLLKSRSDVTAVYPAYLNGKDTVYVGDKIMFELNNEADRGMIEQKLKLSKGAITKTFNMGDHNQYAATVGKEFNVFDVTNNLVEKVFVKFAHPNLTFTAHTDYTPNDTYYSSQWFLNQANDADIDAPQAWGITKGNPNVIIAVMDGHGFDMSHQEMTGKYIYPFDPANSYWTTFPIDFHNDFDPSPDNSFENHATPCAGLIAALTNNNNGVASVGFNIKVMPIKIGSNTQPDGSFSTSDFTIALAADWVINNGQVYAVNNSWGGTQPSGSQESSFNSITTNARGGKGAIVLAATGNDNDGGAVLYPASYSLVVGVGASDAYDHRASFSNYGNIVDIVAPGVNCYTIDRSGSNGYTTGNYTYFSGTSAACPVATAIVGLLASVKPDLTASEYKDMLFQSCEKVGGYSYSANAIHPVTTWNNEMGYGRVNAYNALIKLNILTTSYNPITICSAPHQVKIPIKSLIPFNSGNVFTVQISNSTGSFTSGVTNLTPISATADTLLVWFPLLPSGNEYRIRVKSSSPALTSNTGNKIGAGMSPTDCWLPRKNFDGGLREMPVSFNIGNKGYVGTGTDGTAKKDFWEFDPATNAWTQKADFINTPRYAASGFSIGNKGYLGLGRNEAGNLYHDFYQYDVDSNKWTSKANFPGAFRYGATAFSIAGNGYIGLGTTGNSIDFFKDFYKYNPSNNTWTAITVFPGTKRYAATGFSIGTKGYVGTGHDASTYFNDFYEYNPTIDTWTAKTSFAGVGRYFAVGFSIGAKGYIGTGSNGNGEYYGDLYEYNPQSDVWAKKADLPAIARYEGTGFSIGNKGYIGMGENDGTYLSDLWEYEPKQSILTQPVSSVSYCAGASIIVSFSIGGTFGACTGNVFTAQLSDANGSFASPNTIGSLNSVTSGIISCTIPATTVSSTKYRVRVVSSNPQVTGTNNGANIKINGSVAMPAPISGATSVCSGDIETYTISPVAGASNYTWIAPAGSVITFNTGTLVNVQWFTPGILKVKANNSCFSSAFRTLNVSIACREEEQNNSLEAINYEAFPNPTTGFVKVRFNSANREHYEIKISDFTGKELFAEQVVTTDGTNEKMMDLSKFTKGMYMMTITTSSGSKTMKLVKQ